MGYGNIDPILAKIIPKPGMITLIETKGQPISGFNSSAPFILIPNPKDKAAINFCVNVKPIGWDWAPEHLSREQIPYNQMFIFFGRSQHSKKEVEQLISKQFHIFEIGLSDSALTCLLKTPYGGDAVSVMLDEEDKADRRADPNFERNSQVDLKTAYTRCRALWRDHHKEFNTWETKFVKSIGQQLTTTKPLTTTQVTALGRMFGKYKIKQDATASEL